MSCVRCKDESYFLKHITLNISSNYSNKIKNSNDQYKVPDINAYDG